MKRALVALFILLTLPVLGFVVIAFVVPSDRLVAILDQQIDNASQDSGTTVSLVGTSQLTLFPSIEFTSSLVTLETLPTEDTTGQRTTLEGLTVNASWWQLATDPEIAISVDRMTFDPNEAPQKISGLDAIISRLEFTAFELVLVPTSDGFSLPVFDARLLGGKLTSQVNVENGSEERRISSRGTVDKALASDVLTVLGSSIIPSGYVDLNWDIVAVRANNSLAPAEIFGEATLNGIDLGLSQINLELELCNAYNRASGRPITTSASTSTPIRSLDAIYNLDGYRTDITDLELAIPGLIITGVASIDRTNQDFDAKLKAVIGEGFGEQIPNCNIDKRLSAIEWPVRCRGNLVEDDPRTWCSVELDTLLRRGLESELRRRLNDGGVESLLRSLIPRRT